MASEFLSLIAKSFHHILPKRLPKSEAAEGEAVLSGEQQKIPFLEKGAFLLPLQFQLFDNQTISELKAKIETLIPEYQQASNAGEKLSIAYNITFYSYVIGDHAEYHKWKERSLDMARSMPGGDQLAAPLLRADLDAVEGDYKAAIGGYDKVIGSLKDLEKSGEHVAKDIHAVKGRLKQVLFSHSYNILNNIGNALEIDKRDEAIRSLKRVYVLEPTEASLTAIFAAYAKSAWDLLAIKGKIKSQEEEVNNYYNHLFQQLIGKGGVDDTDQLWRQIGDRTDRAVISEKIFQNEFLAGEFNKITGDLVNLVNATLADEPQKKYFHLADLYAHIGDIDNLRLSLSRAHDAYKKQSGGKVDETRLLQDITCLHRLFALQFRDYDLKGKILDTARVEIDSLAYEGKINQATLLRLENLYLQADLDEEIAVNRFERKEITEDEFKTKMRNGYLRALGYAANNIGKFNDNETRTRVVHILMDIKVTLFEKDLSQANIMRVKGDREEADALQKTVTENLDKTFQAYKSSLRQEDFQELKGHADYSLAYYQFRSGGFNESISNLMNIAVSYPQSSSARMMFSEGSWPREYGITTSQGGFSAGLNRPSKLAALKTIAGKLDDQQGRALAACGVAAAAYIVADLYAGEKISGLYLLGACTMGYAVDKAFVIGESWSEVADSYNTGISNIDTQEALTNAGLFMFDLLSAYAGGFAGRLTQEAALKAGNYLKGRAVGWFIERGALKGPWKRPTAGFALREGSFLANAYTFNKTTNGLRHAVRGDTPGKPKEDHSLWASWLFVRFLPVFHNGRFNLGKAIIKGNSKADLAARFGMNTGVAATAVQGALSLTLPGVKFSSDNVAHTFRDLVLLHLGAKTFEGAIASKRLARLGIKLEELHSEKQRTPKPAEAKRGVNPDYKIGEGQVWFLKDAAEKTIHIFDYTKVILESVWTGLVARPVRLVSGRGAGVKGVGTIARWKAKIAEQVDALLSSTTPAEKMGWLGRRWRAYADRARELLNENWKNFAETKDPKTGETYFDANAQKAYLEAAKKNTAPWKRRSEFSDRKIGEAVENLQRMPVKGEKAPDTIIFKARKGANPAKETASRPDKPPVTFADIVYKTNSVLVSPIRWMGRYVVDVASEVAGKNPRFDATRNIKIATKELHREAVVIQKKKDGIEDPPKALDLLWNIVVGKEGLERAKLNKARYEEAMKAGDPSRLSGWPRLRYNYNKNIGALAKTGRAMSTFYKKVFSPLFETLHVASIFYAGADILFNVNFSENINDNDDKKSILHGMTLPGAISFVMGSNYIVGKMAGITTLGGGLVAELFKSITWAMLMSMNGSDPFKYFSNKPEDIAILHLEYFAVLMGQVMLFSGMHAKPGNPIYKFLTNTPLVRTVPSLTRFYPHYAMRSTFFKPDFVQKGRLLSLAYVGPFHMGVAEVTKTEGFLDAHEYLMWHRLLKVVHLGIWLKPLGAKLNQAGTLGQLVERSTGLVADWVDGLLTPIKIGRPSYKDRLVDNNTGPAIDKEEIHEAAEQIRKLARVNHEIFKRAIRSYDLNGLLGNWVAKRKGYGGANWMSESHFGWRNEVQGVETLANVHEWMMTKADEGEEVTYSTVPVNLAITMDYTLDVIMDGSDDELDDLDVDLDSDSDRNALVIRSAMYKMWAEKGKTDPIYKPFTELVFDNTDSRKRVYWDGIPALKDIHEINTFATEINRGTSEPEQLLEPLR